MTWIDSIWQSTKTKINKILSEHKEPEVLIEQVFQDMQQNLMVLRQTVAEAIALQKRLERQIAENQAKASQCYHQARLAVSQGNEKSAKMGLARRQSYQKNAIMLQTDLAKRLTSVKNLKSQLRILEARILEVGLKKEIYIARARSAEVALKIQQLNDKLNQESTFEGIERKIVILETQLNLIEALNQQTE